MIRNVYILIAAAALVLTGCATSQVKQTTQQFDVKPNSKVIVLQPDVELSLLMAAGMTEVRADWSEAGQENMANSIMAALEARGANAEMVDPSQELTPEQQQLVLLNEAVLASIAAYEYGVIKLPNKKDVFDWTLGPGASELAVNTDADYVMLVQARGSYSSAGKVMVNIAMAALGGPIQTGGQASFASLVDVETGDIVWVNLATAASNDDMRKPEGADGVTETLFADMPL